MHLKQMWIENKLWIDDFYGIKVSNMNCYLWPVLKNYMWIYFTVNPQLVDDPLWVWRFFCWQHLLTNVIRNQLRRKQTSPSPPFLSLPEVTKQSPGLLTETQDANHMIPKALVPTEWQE